MRKPTFLNATVILLTLVISSVCLSHTVTLTPTKPISNNDGRFLFNASLLWYRPNDGQLNYVISSPNGEADIPQGSYRSIDPDYDLGYSLMAGWLFPYSRSDLTLHYKYFSESKGAFTSEPDGGQLFAILGHPEWSLADIENPDEASASVRYKLHDFALEIGHTTYPSCRLSLHWVAGLNYADLDRHFRVTYVLGEADDSPRAWVDNKSKFDGFGISGGIDGNYRIVRGFSLFEKFRAAFLIGDLDFSSRGVNEAELNNQNQPDENDRLYASSTAEKMVIPHLNAKLGVAYTHQSANSLEFTIKAGYQFDQYFNALGQMFFHTARPSSGNEFDGLSHEQYDNLSFNGPFITLGIKI